MAKVAMVQKEKKRARLAAKYAERRRELKAIIKHPDTDDDVRMDAVRRLQELPRDSSPVRKRNRCRVSGRPHGYYRKFGLARNHLRKAAMQGDIPGLVKSSW